MEQYAYDRGQDRADGGGLPRMLRVQRGAVDGAAVRGVAARVDPAAPGGSQRAAADSGPRVRRVQDRAHSPAAHEQAAGPRRGRETAALGTRLKTPANTLICVPCRPPRLALY